MSGSGHFFSVLNRSYFVYVVLYFTVKLSNFLKARALFVHSKYEIVIFVRPLIEKEKAPKPLQIKGFGTGTPEGIRTPDLLVRSQTLYPAELPAHMQSNL